MQNNLIQKYNNLIMFQQLVIKINLEPGKKNEKYSLKIIAL